MTVTRVPWWLSIPATFIPTHAAPVTAGPVLSRDDPGDVETFKQLACWLARRDPQGLEDSLLLVLARDTGRVGVVVPVA